MCSLVEVSLVLPCKEMFDDRCSTSQALENGVQETSVAKVTQACQDMALKRKRSGYS